MTQTNILQEDESIYENNKHEVLQESTGHSGSVLFQFIKSLRIGMDLTRITTPVFVLKPISFLEMQAKYCSPIQDLVSAQINEISSVECMKVIIKWLVMSWANTPQKSFSGLKPYNSILGEQYHCMWDHGDSVSEFHAEQVSHHPPCSCSVLINRERQIVFYSCGELTSSFGGNSVDAGMVNTQIHLDFMARKESYKIEMPNLTAYGLIIGSARVEHSGKGTIVCEESGLKAEIHFAKGHNFTGSICRISNGEQLFRFEGNLTEKVYSIVEEADQEHHSSGRFFSMFHKKQDKRELFMDILQTKEKVPQRRTRKLSQQQHNESRRVWHKVTLALKNNQLDDAAQHKHEIEETQRKSLHTSTYTPRLFQLSPDNNRYSYVGGEMHFNCRELQ